MQFLQNLLRMGFGDAEQRAGGAFGAAVAIFPVLEGAGADADERGELPPSPRFVTEAARCTGCPTGRKSGNPVFPRIPIVFDPPLQDFAAMIVKHVALGLALLAPMSLRAADLFYKKGLTLHVIHDVEQGKTESSRLDTAVGKYTADAGAVLYLKGTSLYLIRDTRKPKAELLDQGVKDFGFSDGLIAYARGSYLYVRRLAEDSDSPARRLANSQGATSFDTDGGIFVFLKNGSELYRVTDLDQGTADRVVYPVTEIQVSMSR